jgi:hypothetical protein
MLLKFSNIPPSLIFTPPNKNKNAMQLNALTLTIDLTTSYALLLKLITLCSIGYTNIELMTTIGNS